MNVLKSRVRLLLLLVIPALLSGCAGGAGIVDSYCLISSTLTVSKNDRLTEGTASQIEAHNLQYERLCLSDSIFSKLTGGRKK